MNGLIMEPGAPWERFYKAARVLAVSPGPIQKRLEYALLELSPLQPHEMAPDVAEVLERLHEVGSTIQDAQQGSIAASAAALRDEEAERVAEEIFSMFITLTRRGGKWEPE